MSARDRAADARVWLADWWLFLRGKFRRRPGLAARIALMDKRIDTLMAALEAATGAAGMTLAVEGACGDAASVHSRRSEMHLVQTGGSP